MDRWMDGWMWRQISLQMDLCGTEVEMAEPSERQGWMEHFRKVRVELEVPHQAEGSKHTHGREFFSGYLQTQVVVISFVLPEHKGKWEHDKKALGNFHNPFGFTFCS